jgi:hypothetical protein
MNISRMLGSLGNAFSGAGRGSSELDAKRVEQSGQSDYNQSRQISAQMDSENRKTAAQIHQIKQETQTKVAEMFRESNLNRTKSASKLHQKWVQQIMV